jgi:lipopolysaccharide biosynthesis glycosyltransferase
LRRSRIYCPAIAATCLATVTDTTYLPGTIVLLSSFLRHNPWFNGDVVVFHDQLSDAARSRLAQFPNVRLHQVGTALSERLHALESDPRLARKRAHFHSLEAFGLRGYDWVLMLDSDVLCHGDAAALVDIEGALVCCPDQSYFWEQPRNRYTYEPTRVAPATRPADVLPISFNVGVMLIRPSRLGDSVYADLLDAVRPEAFRDVTTGHTVSVLLNRQFSGAWTPAPAYFNYLISGGISKYTRPRPPLDEAVFVHFLGRPKPWQAEALAPDELRDPDRRAAFAQWQDAAAGLL